jgi:hypothetical protein
VAGHADLATAAAAQHRLPELGPDLDELHAPFHCVHLY